MDPVALVVTTSGAVAALATIIATSKKWGKWLSAKIGRTAVNEIREKDIEPSSFIGQGFEFNKQVVDSLAKINTSTENTTKEMRDMRLSILRVEILQNIHNTPEKVEIIEMLYDEYSRLGGNNYMHQVIEEWREEYCEKIIRKRITKKP